MLPQLVGGVGEDQVLHHQHIAAGRVGTAVCGRRTGEGDAPAFAGSRVLQAAQCSSLEGRLSRNKARVPMSLETLHSQLKDILSGKEPLAPQNTQSQSSFPQESNQSRRPLQHPPRTQAGEMGNEENIIGDKNPYQGNDLLLVVTGFKPTNNDFFLLVLNDETAQHRSQATTIL